MYEKKQKKKALSLEEKIILAEIDEQNKNYREALLKYEKVVEPICDTINTAQKQKSKVPDDNFKLLQHTSLKITELTQLLKGLTSILACL